MRFILPVLLVLASCAPPVETRYLPPPMAMGGADGQCAVTCEIQQRQCLADAAASTSACFGADSVIARGFNASGRSVGAGVERPICLADRMACQASFNACWQDCGGVVQEVRTGRAAPREADITTPFVVPPLPGASRQSPVPAQRLRIRREDLQRDGLL